MKHPNPNEDCESIRSQYDWANNAPSEAIINAIASLEGVEPVELDITLYDYVDPEALNKLVTGGNLHSISFAVDEYWIKIDGNMLVIYYD